MKPLTAPAPVGTSAHPAEGPAVEVRGLRRTYGAGPDAFEAVRGLDLTVPRGSITALLGVNGAGKTSTLEVLEGLAPATSGEVRVLGLDPVRDRRRLRPRTGVLLQSSGLAGDLTVAETLRMWASTLSRPRPVEALLAELDLGSRADTRVVSLSGGERRRVDLACTLLGDPELIVLDEPTTGLDPESRHRVWQLVRDLADRGRTVLLTTHHLEEAETLADRIALMAAGRVVRSGALADVVRDQPTVIRYRVPGEERLRSVETDDAQRDLLAVLQRAERDGVVLERLEVRPGTLEAAFLAVAEQAAHGGDARPDTRPDTRPETRGDHR